MMIYVTKKKKINEEIKKVIRTLEQSEGGIGKKDLIVSSICIELGVSEANVLEALELFEKAIILKVTDKEIILY